MTKESLQKKLVDNDISHIVELPCLPGDTLYELVQRRKNGAWTYKIVQRTVKSLNIGLCNIIEIMCGTTIIVFASDIGRTVFLDEDEAKKRLHKLMKTKEEQS